MLFRVWHNHVWYSAPCAGPVALSCCVAASRQGNLYTIKVEKYFLWLVATYSFCTHVPNFGSFGCGCGCCGCASTPSGTVVQAWVFLLRILLLWWAWTPWAPATTTQPSVLENERVWWLGPDILNLRYLKITALQLGHDPRLSRVYWDNKKKYIYTYLWLFLYIFSFGCQPFAKCLRNPSSWIWWVWNGPPE